MSNDNLYVQQLGRIKRQPTIDLEQLKQAALAATPGPWEYHEGDGVAAVAHAHGWVEAILPDGGQENADAAFCAAANPAIVLALIERLERAEAAAPSLPPQGGAAKAVAVTADQIYDGIERVLKSHRLQHVQDQDGDGFPLVDQLSSGYTIETGLEEITLICDAIYNEVLVAQAPPVAAEKDAERYRFAASELSIGIFDGFNDFQEWIEEDIDAAIAASKQADAA
jgi:hypothetical protein